VINSSQRPLPGNTQHSQQTDIHAHGGIRTRDLSRPVAVDLRFRPRGHWDRQYCVVIIITITVRLRVPNRNHRVLVCLELTLKRRNYPSAREALAANSISRVTDEFSERSVLLNDF
jgi:hypothetical protein